MQLLGHGPSFLSLCPLSTLTQCCSLPESPHKSEQEAGAASLLQGSSRDRINDNHFWDLSCNLEIVFKKRKDNLGPRDPE